MGPIWFDAERARPQAIRVGRFFDGRFESAPLQIVSVTQPDTAEIDSGVWRVQGEFRNDFDLRRFPFDTQTLQLPFTNATAPMERIVYVVDKRSSDVGAGAQQEIASPIAFRNLTQWDALSAGERRENLVTDSALGDPTRTGVSSLRELSGFLVTVEVERRALATLSKTLLPLVLVTAIMFASLYFPAALVKEKVTVAITGALSGAVLLTAINTQLGSVGYTIAVEYIFYIFFLLCLLCIISVLVCERQRANNQMKALNFTQQFTRLLFLLVTVATIGGMVYLLTT